MAEKVYEVLARYNEDGLVGCHKVTMDDQGRIGAAVAISQAEAADLIATATLAPMPDESQSEPEN
jgi:hypothetical protein